MPNSHPLQISPDVRALLPDEVVTRLHDDPGYEVVECAQCSEQVPPGAPMAAVVLRDRTLDLSHLCFAHPACLRSQVIPADLAHLVRPPAGHDLQISAALVAVGRQVRSALVVESTTQFDGIAPNGETTDLMVKGVLDQGFHLLARPLDVFDLPPVESWDVSVTPHGDGEYGLGLYAAGSEVFTGAAFATGPEWEHGIWTTGLLAVFVGTTMQTPTNGRGHDPQVLDHLAAAGRLAGALVSASVTA